MDTQIAEYIATAKKPKKKPSAAEEGEDEEEDEDEEEGEDENEDEAEDGDDVVKARPAAKTKAKAKGKPKAASAALIGEPGIIKRPSAIAAASLGKFPHVNSEESVYWGGGRVYKAKGNMVRVYAREKDRKDKRISFTDGPSLLVAWEKACRVIVDDDRPR